MASDAKLAGKTVLITRARKQAGALTELLKQEGVRVLEVPVIEVVPLTPGLNSLELQIKNIDAYQWLLLTSTNTVEVLDELLRRNGWSWNQLSEVKIGCIGQSTARRVAEFGATVSVVPSVFRAEALAEELIQRNITGARILLPRAEGSRPILPQMLESAGATVREIHIYRAEIPAESVAELERILRDETLDYITFTSSSTVHHFVDMAGEHLRQIDFHRTKAVSIGPITSATLQDYEIPVSLEAIEYTMQGLVQAMLDPKP